MRRCLLSLGGLLALTACESPWVRLADEKRYVTLVDVDPPKRLRVTLQEDLTGLVHEDVYVAKRCGDYERVPIGSRFPVVFEIYRRRDTGQVSAEPSTSNLRDIFCN